jgi:hypothetical protein
MTTRDDEQQEKRWWQQEAMSNKRGNEQQERRRATRDMLSLEWLHWLLLNGYDVFWSDTTPTPRTCTVGIRYTHTTTRTHQAGELGWSCPATTYTPRTCTIGSIPCTLQPALIKLGIWDQVNSKCGHLGSSAKNVGRDYVTHQDFFAT